MQASDRMEKDLHKSDESILIFSPLSSAKKLKPSTIKKRIFERLRAEEYKLLTQDLDEYALTQEDISVFFSQQGFSIVEWAIISAPTSAPLAFLCENVSQDVLKELLATNDFHILTSFLLGESCAEKHGWYNQEKKSQRIEKFKLLLSIDASGTEEFIQNKASPLNVVPNVALDFTEAVKEFKKPLFFKLDS